MIFRRKQQEQREQRQQEQDWQDGLQNIGGRLQALEQIVSGSRGSLEEMNHRIGGLQTTVSRHDMALEDMLEEWEDKRAGEEALERQIRELENSRKEFLKLFETYMDQFQSMKRFAEQKDSSWKSQMELMEKELRRKQQSCGITVIDSVDVEVDYELHEVIEAVPTDRPELDCRVARVYHGGYIYRGSVQKKAQVAAYRLNTGGVQE